MMLETWCELAEMLVVCGIATLTDDVLFAYRLELAMYS
jgi:hypothetical protein